MALTEVTFDSGERYPVAPALAAVPGIEALLGVTSVVIPAMNEAKNISWVLERMPPEIHEVVLVDGRSTDGTVEVARAAWPATVVVDQPPLGKGAALRAGFAAATGDYIVMIDADGSMDPREIPKFVERLSQGWDLVKGSRSMSGGGSSDLTRIRRLGNRGLLALFNSLFGVRFSELCYGFFAFRRSCLPMLNLGSDGFEIETELVVKAVLAELTVSEVPSVELQRRHGHSNLRPIPDGLRVLRTMVDARLSPNADPVIDLRAPHALIDLTPPAASAVEGVAL